ncbi:MAG TPA: FecR domain-containing protein [Polyangiaceae bacterium]|nr:FecR domain-containing protein [Polyangiaceae bacterium]
MTDPESSSPLRSLQRVSSPERSPEAEAQRRQRVLQRITQLQTELSARPESRTRFTSVARRLFGENLRVGPRARYLAGALALAAALILVFSLSRSPHANLQLDSGLVFVESSHGRLTLDGTRRFELASGDALTTESDPAQLHLPSHAALALEPHTRVYLSPTQGNQNTTPDDHLRLERGLVSLRVPKLAPGQQLTVSTGDALVQVHGTEFSVEVIERPGQAPITRVSVNEGIVSVTRASERILLNAGQSWSSGSAATAPAAASEQSTAPQPAPAEPPPAEPTAPEPAASDVVTANSAPTPAASVGHASDLAEQNRLFLSARQARNSGNTALALQQLSSLMQRYPGSELAHNARVEHFRTLKAAGRLSEARASAGQYLRQYPHGFARAEATRLSAP